MSVKATAERDGVVDKHEKAVFFGGGIFSDGGIISEFTYCTVIREMGLLNEGDVYVVHMHEVIELSVFQSKSIDV